MKKRYLVVALAALIILALPFQAGASRLFDGQNTSQWSTDRTASAAVVTGACIFHGITIIMDGTNDVTFTIYDGIAAAGSTVLVPASQVIAGATWNKTPFMAGQTPGVFMETGIYVSISVAGGGTVRYKVQFDQ